MWSSSESPDLWIWALSPRLVNFTNSFPLTPEVEWSAPVALFWLVAAVSTWLACNKSSTWLEHAKYQMSSKHLLYCCETDKPVDWWWLLSWSPRNQMGSVHPYCHFRIDPFLVRQEIYLNLFVVFPCCWCWYAKMEAIWIMVLRADCLAIQSTGILDF